MRKIKGLSKRQSSILSLILIIFMMINIAYLIIPVTFASTGPTTVGTSTLTTGTQYTYQRLSCFSNGYYYVFWGDGTNIVYSSSPDGITWTAKTTVRVDTNGNGGRGFSVICDTNNNLYYSYAVGTGSSLFYRYGSTAGGLITWTITEQSFAVGASPTYSSISATNPTDILIAEGDSVNIKVFYCSTACGTPANFVSKTTIALTFNAVIALNAGGGIFGIIYADLGSGSSSPFDIIFSTNSGTTWSSAVKTPVNANYVLLYSSCVIIAQSVYCGAIQNTSPAHAFFLSYTFGGAWTEVNMNTIYNAIASAFNGINIATDGIRTIQMAWFDNTITGFIDIASSNNLGATGTFQTLQQMVESQALSGVGTFSGTSTLQTGSSGIEYGTNIATLTVRFAIPNPSSGYTQTTITQTYGSCPAKNNNVITLSNNTIYGYSGNALGFETISTIEAGIASIIGSGSHTFQFLIYVSTSSVVSIQSPLVLQYQKSVVITAGTTNQQPTYAVNLPLNKAQQPPFPFNIVFIGIVADDHIRFNQSLLSGMTSLAGNPSTQAQPNSFTTLGTGQSTKLFFCANAFYQNFIIQTTTLATTLSGSVTTTISTSVTTTITNLVSPTGGVLILNDLIIYLPIWFFPLLFGKILGTTGLLYGLMIALILGIFMGLFPYWTVFLLILMIYFLLR